MSTTALKLKLAEARQHAEAFRDIFDGCAKQWVIAGSIRRGKAEVGDCEHVVVPLVNARGDNAVWEKLETLIPAEGLFAAEAPMSKAIYGGGDHRWGEKYRGVDWNCTRHEIFMADANNFGSILLIRTGSAEFSQRMVTVLKNGRKYEQRGGYVRDCLTGAIIPCPDEQTFFQLCGMSYVEPSERV